MFNLYSKYFYGNEISEYGQSYNRLDYGTLAKAFNHVLNNTLPNIPEFWDYTEQVSGMIDNSEKIEDIRSQIEEAEDRAEELEEGSAAYNEIQRDIEGMTRQIEDLEEEEDRQPEIFQWFIVDSNGADILENANEIVFYNSEMDLYLWGVTHYGTAWDYVLTDIPCNTGEF